MAINFILDHLEEDLTVKSVAEHCCFSKYYFNRLFKAVTGESVYSFIKRLRIERSAFYLKVNPGMSITDVAVRYNLSSSNYSTAFKEYIGISPSKYRKIIEKGISEL
ncbi:MAG: helix-turn-helix transcriptional regulator [Halanaerobiales bacterium]